MQDVPRFIFETLLSELIVVIIGVLFANVIKARYDKWRYGGWSVSVIQHGREVVNRAISPRKAREILDESADLAVFLKGVASPYGWIHCDIISDGEKLGLLQVDRTGRHFTLNLDHNPDNSTGGRRREA